MPNTRARNLRKASTSSEQALWKLVRQRQIYGHRFRRQHPIGPFVVDFVCLERRAIIEVDGDVHDHPARRQNDIDRDVWLEGQRFRILRLSNEIVMSNPELAVSRIETFLRMSADSVVDHPHPPPLRGSERSLGRK